MSEPQSIPGNTVSGNVCPRCGATFTCGMQAGHATCWCAGLPHLPPPDPATPGCYCPDCLKILIAQRQAPA